LLYAGIEVMKREPNVVKIGQPCAVFGDIHGQYFDLANVLNKKSPKKMSFCFLGDYVDRGLYSIECLTLLIAIKLNFPKTVFLLRGNHESRLCAEHFSFREEMITKFDIETYELCL
jgi:serine/threonine-protein phosphatase 2B catalytic subunit